MVYECSICEASLEDQPLTYPGQGQGSEPSGIEAETGADGGNDSAPSITVTPCGHIFHETCLTTWFNDKCFQICPACREICPPDSLTRVFPKTLDLTSKRQNCPGCQDFEEIHQTLMRDYAEMVARCYNAEEQLEFAKTVALNYEKVVRKNLARLLVLKAEKEALTEALRDAHKEIREAMPNSTPEADSDHTPEVNVSSTTEQEVATIIESSPSSSEHCFKRRRKLRILIA